MLGCMQNSTYPWEQRNKIPFHSWMLSHFPFDRSIRQDLKQLVAEVQHKYPQLVPGLAIVQVGGRDDSNVYIRMKIRAAAEIGITAQHVQLPRTVTQSELLAKVSHQCSRCSGF